MKEVRRLGDLCEVIMGQSPKGESYNVKGEGTPFFQGKAEFGELFPTIRKWTTAPGKLAKPGDVLLSVRAPVGPTNLCVELSCIGRGLAALRPREGIPTKFIFYGIQATVEKLREVATGSTFEAVSGSHVRSHMIGYAEGRVFQQRLVDHLDLQFSRLDAGIAALKRAQANLKRYRASVLQAACEGRLVPTEHDLAQAEGRDYETATALISRTPTPARPNRWKSRSSDYIPGHRALCIGKQPPGAEHGLNPLPPGWKWTSLVEVAKMESGHTPSRARTEWWNGSIPWITLSDARGSHGGLIRATEEMTNADGLANSAARLLPTGTVCISRTASVGYVVEMALPMATSQDFVNWVPTPAVISGWLRVVFSADREVLLRFGKGSVHKTIYFPEWLSVSIALPPLPEQVRIVAEVERRLSVVDQLESTLTANLQRATRLRQAILKKAFSYDEEAIA